jgi:hypothetical protein
MQDDSHRAGDGTDRADRPSHSDIRRVVPFCVAAIAVAVGLWAGRPYAVGVFHDDGVYAVLAKALATGQGYRYLHLPGAPAATHYPPGYPLLLSLVWRLAPSFPENVALLIGVNALLLGGIALAVERFARTVLGWPPLASALVALAATVTYPLLMLSSLVLSEPLFAALLVPVLMASERAVRGDENVGRAFWLGVCAGLLGLVRTHGIALLVALVLTLALRRRFRAAAMVVAGAALMLAPWQVWSMVHAGDVAAPLRGSYGSYLAWLTDGARVDGLRLFVHTVAVNVREVAALLADRLALRDTAVVRGVTAWLAIAMMLAGAWCARRKAPVTIAFLAVYVAIMLVWPYTPWRFVFAIWPLLLLLIGEPLVAARHSLIPASASRHRHRALATLTLVAGVVFVAGMVREEARAYSTRSWRQGRNAATAQIAPLVAWVNANTKSTDVVAVEGEQLVYLFTGRQAVPLAAFTAAEYRRAPTLDENVAMLSQILKGAPVSHVVSISPPLVAAADSLSARSIPGEPHLERTATFGGGQTGAAYVVRR